MDDFADDEGTRREGDVSPREERPSGGVAGPAQETREPGPSALTQFIRDAKTNQRKRLIGATPLALLVGVGASFFGHLHNHPEKAGTFGGAAWLFAALYCVALCFATWLFLASWRDRVRAVAAMWRPLAVVVFAGYLLLFQEQVRELGISLMTEDAGLLRFVLLFLALLYWALNGWHSAKLGVSEGLKSGFIGEITNAYGAGEKRRVASDDTPWLFWGPRFVGVCAHLLAAVNLALSAQKQPEFQSLGGGIAALFAPVAIASLTWLVYMLDIRLISERRERNRRDRGLGQAQTVVGKAGELGLLLVLACLSWSILAVIVVSLFVPTSPPGFLWGTYFIGLSAVVYLVVMSYVGRKKTIGAEASKAARRANDAAGEYWYALRTLGLFLVAAVVVAGIWRFGPERTGEKLGSMVIVYFTFGVFLSTLNALEWTTAWLAKKIFGPKAQFRIFHAYAAAGVICFCVINAWLRPFHHVRDCAAGGCGASAFAAGPNDRPTVKEAAEAWYAEATAAYARRGVGLKSGDTVPMLIVATAGGGIRAADWTAAALEKLDADLQEIGGARPYLFAISGVSGGSVGATAFEAALAARDEAGCQAGAQGCPVATKFLRRDFLAPALASWLFEDTVASLLPSSPEDRAAALEQAFESASSGLLARPFLSFVNWRRYFESGASQTNWRPILLLNATHEETGRRVIASQVLVERDVFVDAFDELNLVGADIRASTAAVNSARFVYLSPAGELKGGEGSVIDGGYFENFGALTALEVARAAEEALKDKPNKVRLILLVISSDPSLFEEGAVTRIHEVDGGRNCVVSATERVSPDATGPNYLPGDTKDWVNAWINEFDAPLLGIENIREAHGARATAELALKVCADYSQTTLSDTSEEGKNARAASAPARAQSGRPYFAHLAMCNKDGTGDFQIDPPLGWMLSRSTRNRIEKELFLHCGNADELRELEIALGKS